MTTGFQKCLNAVTTALAICKTKKAYLKVIAAVVVLYLIYNDFYCSLVDSSPKVPFHLDELKIYLIPVNYSVSSSRDLIVIMTPKVSSRLVQRLQLLDVRFSDNFRTPLLLLHSSRQDESHLVYVLRRIKRPVMLLDISRLFSQFPANFDPCRTKSSWSRRGKWNYHVMIRFWFKTLFELPQLQHYEYIMRLDDDSQVLGKWINVFDEMRLRKAVYFANDKDADVERSLPGLIKLQHVALKYVVMHNITVKQPAMVRDGFGEDFILNYFNNFEVVKVEFFRREEVRRWIEEVDRANGIFKYRWGDSTLRYITLAMFAESNEVMHRPQYNLSYCHKC